MACEAKAGILPYSPEKLLALSSLVNVMTGGALDFSPLLRQRAQEGRTGSLRQITSQVRRCHHHSRPALAVAALAPPGKVSLQSQGGPDALPFPQSVDGMAIETKILRGEVLSPLAASRIVQGIPDSLLIPVAPEADVSGGFPAMLRHARIPVVTMAGGTAHASPFFLPGLISGSALQRGPLKKGMVQDIRFPGGR